MPSDAPHGPLLEISRRGLLRLAGLGGLGVAMSSLLPGCGDSEAPGFRPGNYAATLLDAREAIRAAMAHPGGPTAVSLALVDHQRIVWAETFGFLDKARGLAPTPDTRFGLASGSKVFAAIATLILVDRGLIDLDTPLVQYVPDFRMARDQAYARITPRQLLSHSSGLPGTDYRNGTTFFPVAGHAAQVMATLASQRLKHAPGEMAVYCNDGFSLIEPLVTAVTGQSYTDFIRQEIFRPLGMTHSCFGIETLAPDSYATALRANGEPYPQEYINVLSTGGIYSTPSDMGRLAMMLMAGGRQGEHRLLSAWAVTEMGLDQSATLPLNPLHENDFGLGWDGVRQGGLAAVGVTAWHKNGGSVFFSTQFDVAPDEGLAVIIMAAGGALEVETLAERILLQALAERGSITGVPAPLTPHPPPRIPTSEAELLALVGHYAAEKLYRLEPGADQSLTWSEFVEGAWVERIARLQRRQGGDLIADSAPDRALLVIEADGRPHLALREPKGLKHYASATTLGQLLAPLAPLSAPWRARLQHRWLMVNDPYSTLLALGMPPLFNLWQAPGLTGYLVAAGKVVNPSASDDHALMCTKVAARDLNDLIMVQRNGEEWVRWGSTLYRPLATVSRLATGHHLITIGDEGLGVWRRLTAAADLEVAAANSWYLYGPDFQLLNAVVQDKTITQDWEVRVPDAAYLLVQGDAGASIQVSLG